MTAAPVRTPAAGEHTGEITDDNRSIPPRRPRSTPSPVDELVADWCEDMLALCDELRFLRAERRRSWR